MTAAAAFFASHRNEPSRAGGAGAAGEYQIVDEDAFAAEIADIALRRARDAQIIQSEALADIALYRAEKAIEQRQAEANELVWDALLSTADDEAAGRFIEGFWIVSATALGISALFVAIDSIAVALAIVVLAALCARRAVLEHRRADALTERAASAELAEGNDPITVKEAA